MSFDKKFFELVPIRYGESLEPENFINKINWVSSNYCIWPIEETQRLGWDSRILLHADRRKSIKSNNIKFESFKTIRRGDILFSYPMVKYIQKEKPDFVYCHNGMWTNWAVLKTAKHSKKILMPHYMLGKSFLGKFIFNNFEKKFFKYADRVIALTKWEKDILMKFLPEEKIVIIPHPIDLSKFSKYERKNNDGIILASVCGVFRGKGLDMVAKIWNDLEKKYKNIKWYIAGSIADKSLYEEIKSVTHNSKNVIFLGYLQGNNIADLLLKTDIYIQPSIFECFGLSLVEAQAFGLPIVTGNQAAIPHVVAPENCFVNHGDVKKLKQDVMKLIEDKKLREKIGKGNKEYIKQFDYPIVKNKFLNMLEELNET